MKQIYTTLLLSLIFGNLFSQDIQYKSQPNADGIIRCHTMEADSIRRFENPSLPSLAEQESWLQDRIEEKLENSHRIGGVILTIPVIFHIITDSVGAENIADSLVYAQVDQLNIDFRNLAGSTDTVAADIEIEFCLALVDEANNLLPEPGINRVTSLGDGPFTMNFFDNTVKPATIWSPTEYLNIWSADLSGGLLGWAQFPSASGLNGLNANGGGANSDGVVALYSSIGSVAMPNPGGGPYVYGRTMTHEVGHWLGLRHIWGDTGCGGDDFCDDTPLSDGSNFGCPTGHVSCTTIDMVENYMDYTDDLCMNIFTLDQRDRMETVMTVSPRRMELPSSTKCSASPTIAFANSNVSGVIEATDCGFTEYTLDLTVNFPPSADATVNFTPTASNTATVGQDFDFIPTSVVFPAGSTANQQVVIRVYNDGVVEGNELIEYSFIVVTSGDAVAATGASAIQSFTITDNDILPANAGTVTLFQEDFEGGVLAPFTTQALAASDSFSVGDDATATSAFWTTTGNASLFAFSNDDECDCDKSEDYLTMPLLDFTNSYNAVTLSFDHAFSDVDGEVAEVQVSTGGAFSTLLALSNTSTGGGSKTTPWVTDVSVDLSPYIGEDTVIIRFFYNDGGGWEYGIAVDNVEVVAESEAMIQTITNSTNPTSISFNDSETVHFYDEVSGNIMASIENLSSWDYGCTSVSVNRDAAASGSFSAPFYDPSASFNVAAKTFFIPTTNNLLTGNYNITLYYTEAEIAGWELETGRTRSEIEIIKVSGGTMESINAGNYNTASIESQAATVGAFGSDGVTLSAVFTTGFSGFGMGVLPQVLLPVELISFEGKAIDERNKLEWFTATEIDNSHFELSKSADGINFQTFHTIEGAGNSTQINAYIAFDEEPFNVSYYKLTQFDFNGKKTDAEIITVSRSNATETIELWPNPTDNRFTIALGSADVSSNIKIYDSSAALMGVYKNVNSASIQIDAVNWPKGVYYIQIQNSDIQHLKLIKL